MPTSLRPRLAAWAAGAVIAAVLVAGGVAARGVDEPSAGSTSAPSPNPPAASRAPNDQVVYTFVSAPDLLNADIGDVRSLPRWREGMPNSTNGTDEESLRRLFTDIASTSPDAVLVGGDEVRGHWDEDGAGLRLFGPVDTRVQQRAAIARAARFYYPIWTARFPTYGIDRDRVFPAVGDHELGDNPWPAGSSALAQVPWFKQQWADAFTLDGEGGHRYPLHPVGTAYDDTAYATYLTPDLLLVTIDPFAWSSEGMRVTVTEPQLTWLDQVLDAAPPTVTVLVQGHVPVLTPVRMRGSSRLHLEGGADSALWQLLREHGVDLYLDGEVHDFTATQVADGDPVQVAHGGLFAHGTTSYLLGRVLADGTLTLEARTMVDQASPADLQPRLWQTRNDLQWKVRLPEQSESVGTMRIAPGRHVVESTGVLAPLAPGEGSALDGPDDVDGAE